MLVHFNGRLVNRDEVRISPDDRGFLFADGVYEVVRAYRGRLFRAADHWRRLARSLGEVRIGVGNVDFQAICESLLRENNLLAGDATVYLQVTRGPAPRQHAFPDAGVAPTVYACATPFQPATEKQSEGVRVILLPDIRWTRCDIKSLALLPNVLAAQQAKERGADEALFVRAGCVTEGSRTNFAAVLDSKFVTHPQNNLVLGGVTLNAVLDLCRKLGVPVSERPIKEAELKSTSEMMIIGTTTEITPVIRVEDWQVGEGVPGPLTLKLQRAFREMVT